MGLLTSGIAMLARRTKQAAGVSITYTRRSDATTLPGVVAVVGETPFRFLDPTGFDVLSRRRDFIIDSAALALPDEGGLFEPVEGDEITQTIGTVSHRYIVGAPNDEPCFRYQDPEQSRVRIHTHEEVGDG